MRSRRVRVRRGGASRGSRRSRGGGTRSRRSRRGGSRGDPPGFLE